MKNYFWIYDFHSEIFSTSKIFTMELSSNLGLPIDSFPFIRTSLIMQSMNMEVHLQHNENINCLLSSNLKVH